MTGAQMRLRRVVAGAVLLCGMGFLAGFRDFTYQVTRAPVGAHGAADAIVVLTGGRARLEEAGRLMREGWGRRLLISGVNPKTSQDDLIRLTGIADEDFRCCVDIGYAALDTIGNAGETREWAASHRYQRLIVVTAAYHMPRSLAEFAHALPGVDLTPHPVMAREGIRTRWWQETTRLRILLAEYVKYVTATARLAVARSMATVHIGVPDGAVALPAGAVKAAGPNMMAHGK